MAGRLRARYYSFTLDCHPVRLSRKGFSIGGREVARRLKYSLRRGHALVKAASFARVLMHKSLYIARLEQDVNILS